MNEKDALQLPFLTRSMLDFGKEAVFELETVAYSNNAGAVRLVGLTKGALIKFDVSHAGDHNEEVKTFRITDIPIMLNVFTDDVTIEVGEWFASVYLKVNGERVMKLMSGYVSKQSGISYPQTHDESEVPLRGNLTLFQVTNPSAGADWIKDVPSNRRWMIKYVVAKLTSDANGGNRRPHIQFAHQGDTAAKSMECIAGATFGVSVARKLTFAPYGSLPTSGANDDILVVIPPNIDLGPGSRIQTDTDDIQVGDQWSDIFIAIEEFLED